ncbi:SHOCT domain-containing protein [Paraoerskovia marina]|uniref:SHOCT domain-containing protein n=1 Tax=Paraoerskovia marina TaxID=545619 RepID=UPI0004926A94|nr:SHOCT domain-containing protein [Paraoerskovia marina]
MVRRVGRPGLIGTMARTAVISGTATAVSGGVQRRQMNRQQANYEEQQRAAAEEQARMQAAAQQAAAQQAAAQQVTAAQAPAQVTSAGGGDDLMAQLERLAQLKSSGILSDAEFAAAKAKLLG